MSVGVGNYHYLRKRKENDRQKDEEIEVRQLQDARDRVKRPLELRERQESGLKKEAGIRGRLRSVD